MSHDQYATSMYNSRPAELYEFRYGDGASEIIYYTSADHDITIGGHTYTSISLSRDKFTDDGNPDDGNSLRLSMPINNALASLYMIQPPEKAVTVKIKATQLSDPAQQFLVLWSGRVTAVSFEYPECAIQCERIATSLRRTGVTSRYYRHCRHCHYDHACGLDREDYKVEATVTAISGRTMLTVPAAGDYADKFFAGGILVAGSLITIAGGTLVAYSAMRLIIQHSGSQIKISRPIIGLSATADVTLYPGCDRSAATCKARFDNLFNYGGFDFVPDSGPFDGNGVSSIG